MTQYTYGVLGAGMQGTAAAYGLAKFGGAASVVLMDLHELQLRAAAERLKRILPGAHFETRLVDASQLSPKDLQGVHGLISAASYRVNLAVTQACIRSKVHMVDLGGNTEVVRHQHELSPEAEKASISIVPDLGLAPGLGNILASYGFQLLPNADAISIRCGGLPQNPSGPLKYHLVFSVEGLVNEYLGQALVLENGILEEKETLTGLEELDLPQLGRMEAFYTSGGVSTLPYLLKGKLKNLNYKTVRYPGHCEKIKAMKDLGLWSEEAISVGNGKEAVPRQVFEAVAKKALTQPGAKDLVVLNVECRGHAEQKINFFLLDHFEETTGFSAMERTTAFPAAIVLMKAVQREIPPGVRAAESCLPFASYLDELQRWGINVQKSE